jgi:butyryl-CoA dehydrogenase
MGYILGKDGQAFVKTAKNFAEKELKPHVAELEKKGGFPYDIYKKAAQLGLTSLEVDEANGGPGLEYVTIGAIYEEVAKVDSGFAVNLAATSLAYKPVMLGGTPEQIKHYADIMAGNGLAAFALTEPNAGSDAGAVKTTAVKDGGDYVLNGRKCFITNGGIADVYTVFASTDPSKKLKGLTAFIVDKGTPGLSAGKEEDKMGIRLSHTADVVFENVRIPARNIVGKEGEGFKLAMLTLDLARATLAPMAVGISQRALEEATAYAKQRVQFGNPIASLQAIQFMLADMNIRTETARQMSVHALRLVDNKLPYAQEAAIAKCYAGDTAVQNALDAIQILGGYGYSREYPVEKLLRDAKIFQIFEGTNQVQRVVIAANMLR